jgi:hypothetical protein
MGTKGGPDTQEELLHLPSVAKSASNFEHGLSTD